MGYLIDPSPLIITMKQDFVKDTARARRWKGLRQDSGDPYVYAPRAREIYESLGIDHKEKMIIFSDSVNLDKALGLKKQCDEIGFQCKQFFGCLCGLIRSGVNVVYYLASFGIGTFLTNDFYSLSSGGREKSKALNMVIKLSSVGGQNCVKISDELTKASFCSSVTFRVQSY